MSKRKSRGVNPEMQKRKTWGFPLFLSYDTKRCSIFASLFEQEMVLRKGRKVWNTVLKKSLSCCWLRQVRVWRRPTFWVRRSASIPTTRHSSRYWPKLNQKATFSSHIPTICCLNRNSAKWSPSRIFVCYSTKSWNRIISTIDWLTIR